MAKLKFRNGIYDVPAEFTGREMMEVERISGVPASVVEDGLTAEKKIVHYSTLLAWAWIAIKRAGASVTLDELLDSPAGAVEWMGEDDPAPLDEASDAAALATTELDGNPPS